MPYLPVNSFDDRLKILCVLSVTGILLSIHYGWNGSGGILFAIYWEMTRGLKIGIYGIFFGLVILGSLILEHNYSVSKLWEFLPGLLFGYVNSEIFKLKESNPYAITHQFIFLASIALPIFFPAAKLIIPSLFQWLVMILSGAVLLVAIVLTIKLMQLARVSVVMSVLSGVFMITLSSIASGFDYFGAICIILGIGLLIKKEFYGTDF